MYENNTRLTLTLIALPKHEQHENQPNIPITSHTQKSRKLTAKDNYICKYIIIVILRFQYL